MEVFLSKRAESKLLELNMYLLESWGLKTRDKFISKLTNKIKQISSQPNSCPKSSEYKNLYKCVVTKHTILYYRISHEQNRIEIITVFDTRQNPNKLKEDLNK